MSIVVRFHPTGMTGGYEGPEPGPQTVWTTTSASAKTVTCA